MLGGDPRDRARRVEVEGQRAEVVDDDEIGAVERGAERLFVERLGWIDRQSRDHEVVGRTAVFDRTRDAPGSEAEGTQRAGPLACFDRHAVVAAEAERDRDCLRRHARKLGECRAMNVSYLEILP